MELFLDEIPDYLALDIATEYKKLKLDFESREDFHDKCYICEIKELQDPQVEHLLPHKNGKYKERKFDWENLFWACGHCNGVKNQKKYEEGIACAVARDENDREAVLAAQLVTEVFNIRNTGMRIHDSELRMDKLQEEMNVLYTKLEQHKKNRNPG